jgi:hypothetical protein
MEPEGSSPFYTTARHWFVSWAKCNQSTPSFLSSHLHLVLSSRFFPFTVFDQIIVAYKPVSKRSFCKQQSLLRNARILCVRGDVTQK